MTEAAVVWTVIAPDALVSNQTCLCNPTSGAGSVITDPVITSEAMMLMPYPSSLKSDPRLSLKRWRP